MKISIFKYIIFVGLIYFGVSSCSKQLDLYPQNDLTSDKVYASIDGYKNVLAKLYGSLAISGNTGPSGTPDIGGGLDEGSQVGFIRAFFNLQELPTDEAVVAWNDQTIHSFHNLSWTSSDPFIRGMYARPIYNITLINEFLRESTPEKVASRNISGSDATAISNMRGEARFLRAFNYWVMLDLFGKSTFITENDLIGSKLPTEISRADLFTYIESELKIAETELAIAKSIEYGRVDQSAAWALLARLYINANIYAGVNKYSEAVTYSEKVINAGYTLSQDYNTLFMADNDKHKNEIIYAINCDGLRTKSFGNTTFLTHAFCGDDFREYGVNSGWGGYRATAGLSNLFSDLSGETDNRALFTTSVYLPTPSQINIPSIGDFKNGLHVKKYVNLRSDGNAVNDPISEFSDIDFPVFRLPEMYLIYTEAVLRGGTPGSGGNGLEYINLLRQRAYGNNSGNISAVNLNLQFILDERGRELYWEGHRRTDLIRFGLLTNATYLWPWKGGVLSGTAVNDKFNLYPIPATNRNANPNLSQNEGY